MPIIGMNFNRIEASFDESKLGESRNIDVKNTPFIENVKKKEVNVPSLKDVLSVEFKFVTEYTPKIGGIEITGEVLYQSEDAKKILDAWKNKKLDSRLAADVLNAIFRKCLTKAVNISDELRLPPPLTFPIVTAQAPGQKKASAQ